MSFIQLSSQIIPWKVTYKLPSRELAYPTLVKGTSFSKLPWEEKQIVPRKVFCPKSPMIFSPKRPACRRQQHPSTWQWLAYEIAFHGPPWRWECSHQNGGCFVQMEMEFTMTTNTSLFRFNFGWQACSGFFFGRVSKFEFLEIILSSGLGVTILPWLYSICFNSFWFDLISAKSHLKSITRLLFVPLSIWVMLDHDVSPTIQLYHLESRWCNSHVLVYHGPLLFATFWEWLVIYFHHSVNLLFPPSNPKSHHGFILSVPWCEIHPDPSYDAPEKGLKK